MNILFLSPHTDDVELGCGGTMSRFISEGKNIFVSIFSTCKAECSSEKDLLKEESFESLKQIGVKEDNIYYNNYPVRNFNLYRQNILDYLIFLRNELQPTIVFLPSRNDVHQDHAIISLEGVRCFKNSSSIYGYQLPWNLSKINNDCIFSFDDYCLDKKILALSKYKSQEYRKYMQKDYIKSSAYFFGINGIERYAESFEIITLKQ